MHPRTLIPFLLLSLLAAPVAAAALPGAGLVVDVPAPAARDELGYRVLTPDGREREVAIRFGEGGTRDAFYQMRDVVLYETAEWERGELVRAEECKMLSGGREAVLRLVLHDDRPVRVTEDSASAFLRTSEFRSERYRWLDWSPRACDGFLGVGGARLREGDVLRLTALLGHGEEDALSAPATAAPDFHGRPALRFAFATSAGLVTVLVADGLAGVARLEHPARGTWELVSYATGGGWTLPAAADARLPARDEAREREAYDPLWLDDRAFALPFPYGDAFVAALDSPQSSLRAFLAEHPDAVLLEAVFDQPPDEDGDSATTRLRSTATWRLAYGDAEARLALNVTKERALRTFLGEQPLPRELVTVEERALPPAGDFTRPAPAETLASAAVLQLADEHAGWRAGDFRHVAYVSTQLAGPEHPAGTLELGRYAEGARQAPEGDLQGAVLSLDLHAARALAYEATAQVRETRGALSFDGALPQGMAPYRGSGLLGLALPHGGAGLAVGALAGLALLALAAKLAAPLFTRLARARLLDHPVRARLHERVRQEPGIRQAELLAGEEGGDGITRRHLARLVKHGLVVEVRDGARVGYYLPGAVPPDEARRALALRSEAARRAYALLSAEPHLPLREAARRLGVSAASLHRQRKRLEAAGLLPARGDEAEPVPRAG